ncbi:MAG TPA: methionyl-tRNA formyltransferase [Bryobacteraceae bacterium]|jgi:methionyl-tRNA formyltransferase|nr:methionyl-tRNA formyltransferase [Bryobacteraceae bacterium]
MRTVFLGTPEFAVPTLQALVESGLEVVAVITQPDRPKGRGGIMTESPVKRAAVALGLPVHQPERIRRPENVELLRSFNADVMVVVGYGQIIPQAIIDLPPKGIFNVHASLLPKYRGAAPIQWAIANGERETGVTIMKIDAGLDTGDMLLKSATAIGPDETAPELAAHLAVDGAKLLIKAMLQVDRLRPEKQDNSQATYAPILKKEDGLVDWTRPAYQIDNRLRGFTPWPGAYTRFRGQQLTIMRARIETGIAVPVATLHSERRRLYAGCGEGTLLELLEIQLEGKRRMSAEAFLNGYQPGPGEILGESH